MRDLQLSDFEEEEIEQEHGTQTVCNLPEPLVELVKRCTTDLNEEERQQVITLLKKYQHVFSLSDNDLGKSNQVHHQIETGNASSIRQRPRTTAPWKQAEIERQVTTLLEEGMIEESNSSLLCRWCDC